MKRLVANTNRALGLSRGPAIGAPGTAATGVEAAPGPAGYGQPGYAAALAEFGEPLALAGSGGWLLRRAIGGGGTVDAMGCYPLFACADWSRLGDDIDALEGELVSVVLVTDPFGRFTPGDLEKCFPDCLRLFKQHHVVELGKKPTSWISRHHQRNARRALARVRIDACDRPAALSGEWSRLYDGLCARHAIGGLRRFSARSFARQLALPGVVAFRASIDDEAVGMLLWLADGPSAYYHLGACSERGRAEGAAFALFRHAIDHFNAAGMQRLDLGAGADAAPSGPGEDGLARFKRGWANATRAVYLCGRVLDRARYRALAAQHGTPDPGYFPAYRAGEFSSPPR